MAVKLGSPSSSSNKQMKKMGVDRLSALPDSLLISILSLLSTREAIRTCVLSRRWLFLWTDLPELAFREERNVDKKISEFVDWVYNCLLISGGNHLRRFEVSFCYKDCFASDVDAWVRFALKHKVKDVALTFSRWEDHYLLPQMMYSNSYLTCLSLRGCIVAPKNTIQWGTLSSLYLDGVEFEENAIEMIYVGCPVLYDLHLEYCRGLNYLNVKSQSVRELAVIGSDADADDGSFPEISAPLIHYANISVYLLGRKFRFSNISSLVEADIDFEGYEPYVMRGIIGYAKELFQSLRHVKELKVGPEFIRALSRMVVYERVRLSRSRLRCLKLDVLVDEYSTSGIVCLLESSPNLKTLHISLSCLIDEEVKLKKHVLKRDLLHLKTVTIDITVYKRRDLGFQLMLTLVPLLLKRAAALEKMVIELTMCSTKYLRDNYMEIVETLLSCPRASTKAVVLAPVKFLRD